MKRRNHKAAALRRATRTATRLVDVDVVELAKTRARRTKGGMVLLCTPSHAELVGDAAPRGSEKKLIYDSMEDATWTAAVVAAATGEPPMNAYVCPRSTRQRHLHLTRKPLSERDRHAVTERTAWASVPLNRPRRRHGEGSYVERP